MEGEDVYGNKITLQTANSYNRSNLNNGHNASLNTTIGSGVGVQLRTTSLVARRNLPYNRYSAYPQQNVQNQSSRLRSSVYGRDHMLSANDLYSVSLDFENVNNSNNNGWVGFFLNSIFKKINFFRF